MTAAELNQRFDAWFSQTGHWIYENKAAALKQWMENGIDGLPKYRA